MGFRGLIGFVGAMRSSATVEAKLEARVMGVEGCRVVGWPVPPYTNSP